MIIKNLGLIDFHEAYALQERLAAGVAAGTEEETLLLLEHPPVYTIGSGGKAENILDPSITAVRINRGGDVTYHGPGQLVGYPIVDLGRRGRDLHRYLRFLEELLIRTAAVFGVASRPGSGEDRRLDRPSAGIGKACFNRGRCPALGDHARFRPQCDDRPGPISADQPVRHRRLSGYFAGLGMRRER